MNGNNITVNETIGLPQIYLMTVGVYLTVYTLIILAYLQLNRNAKIPNNLEEFINSNLIRWTLTYLPFLLLLIIDLGVAGSVGYELGFVGYNKETADSIWECFRGAQTPVSTIFFLLSLFLFGVEDYNLFNDYKKQYGENLKVRNCFFFVIFASSFFIFYILMGSISFLIRNTWIIVIQLPLILLFWTISSYLYFKKQDKQSSSNNRI